MKYPIFKLLCFHELFSKSFPTATVSKLKLLVKMQTLINAPTCVCADVEKCTNKQMMTDCVYLVSCPISLLGSLLKLYF